MITPNVAVFKEFVLYCAHSVQLFGPDHKCAKKHGHSYRIRIEVHQFIDPGKNIVIPFEDIQIAWDATGAKLDHTDLNDKFGPDATTEVLAMYLQGKMTVALGRQCSIEVRETDSSGVVIRA